MNLTLRLVLALCSLCGLLLIGCASPPPVPPGDPPDSLAETNLLRRIERVSAAVAQSGATYDLTKNPEHRAWYEASNEALAAMIAANDFDPARFQAAIEKLPIQKLQGEGGAIAIGVTGAVFLWEEVNATSTEADRAPRVKAFTVGVHKGLTAALAATAKSYGA